MKKFLILLTLTCLLISSESRRLKHKLRNFDQDVMPFYNQCTDEAKLSNKEKLEMINKKVAPDEKIKMDENGTFSIVELENKLTKLWGNSERTEMVTGVFQDCYDKAIEDGLNECGMAWDITVCVDQKITSEGLLKPY